MSAAPVERHAAAARMTGLRANSFAAIVILLIEYGLGAWVSLYGHLPASGGVRPLVAALLMEHLRGRKGGRR